MFKTAMRGHEQQQPRDNSFYISFINRPLSGIILRYTCWL